MLALLAAGVALAVAAGAQDSPAPGSRFVCTALPPEAVRAGCPLPAMPMQGGALSPEEELRAAVLQLRETVVQQKETLGAQREAIRELTGKLARCEGLASGKARGAGTTGKDTMGDLPRDPGHVVEQLSRSLQTLKDRLESLEGPGMGTLLSREGGMALGRHIRRSKQANLDSKAAGAKYQGTTR
ncbi:Neuronal pentraxin-2 [Saguinus oedipus]|uniref:Neuronal pentraxin-2 n=1 Tax=Saguinus oedipus TaxID=9490 RepID=A0ABQ9W7T5_SAGOE|nr:Neuronal pentraxin-2 [Saguinus oedipus]